MLQQFQRFYEFDSFRIDGVRRLLTRDGDVVQLTHKAFDVLLALVEQRRVSCERWSDEARMARHFVEEGNLTNNISTLRKALGSVQGLACNVAIPIHRCDQEVQARNLAKCSRRGRLAHLLLSLTLQPLNVRQILSPTRGALVANQVISRQHPGRLIRKSGL